MSHAKSVLGKRKAHIEEGESPSLECYETLDMEQVRKDARQFAAAEDEKRKQQPLPPKTIDPLSSASSCSSSTESLKRAVSSLTVNPPSVQAVVSHQKSSDTTATVHVNVIKNLLDLDNDPDLVSYMLATEKAYHPDGNYMCVQNVINNETRAVMMDWMMAIAHEFELTHETLYLALNYADRHMAREVMIAHPNSELLIPTSQLPVQPRRPSAISTPAQSIDRKNYQCFGIACLQIAAKFEQLMLPNAHDLVAATASSCTIGQLNEMELNVLRGLNYRLSAQTPHAWLKLFLKLMVMESRNKMALPDDAKMSNVEMEMQREFECMRAASDPFVQSLLSTDSLQRMMRLINVAYLDSYCLSFYPSALAVAALCTVHGKRATEMMPSVSGYADDQLVELLDLFRTYQSRLTASESKSTRRSLPSLFDGAEDLGDYVQHTVQYHDTAALSIAKDIMTKRKVEYAKSEIRSDASTASAVAQTCA